MLEVPYQEQLSGIPTLSAGLVSAFNLTYTPINSTLLFFTNGVYQTIDVDYTLTDKQITTTLQSTAYDYRASYIYTDPLLLVRKTVANETLFGNATAPTSMFTLQHTPITGSLNVYWNGILQRNYIDYNNYGNVVATTSIVPLGNVVTASYDWYGYRDTILPDGTKGSTTLNPVITAYDPLLVRIKRQFGWPTVEVEVCDDAVYDNINQAIEWYSKYAGYTEEFLIFSSELYKDPGLRLDKLFTLTSTMRELMSDGLSASWDYDLQDYRKVIGIFEFHEGSSTGINALFTLEQAMAQQTYFSYMLGNVGFDLVTWECLKGWLDLREKVLAQVTYVDFDNRTQILRLIPAPNKNARYYGVVGCWVERPIKDLIRERWVYQYSLALTKIIVANVRGKYTGTQMFGGGTINYNDLMSQGLEEKKKLEDELLRGYGESAPARFFVG